MEKQKVANNKSRRRWLIVILIIIVLGLLFDIFMVGNIGYAVKWVECGQRPVVVRLSTGIRFGAEPIDVTVIEKPGFFDIKDVFSPLVDSKLYCNTEEAKASVSGFNQVEYK